MTEPLDAVKAATTAGEREMLEVFLDYHRRTIVMKIDGLSEEDVRRRLVPSLTTPLGLIKHLTVVEMSWFQRRLAQRAPEDIEGYLIDDVERWTVGPADTIAGVVAGYAAACAESRRTAAGYDLDHVVPHDRFGEVSLRWIYVHMIEETAQHAGHADILREQIDGATQIG